ncbi:MAG TPA: hypothetical protein VFV87_20370, partial [Pirellulaceae bacterium]|nr:hypothetical protein [Pirellulaceae bacterium]
GKPRELAITQNEIDELLITVSPKRLAELDPSQPQLYREYAEELAEKHRDPEARDAAIRLYHLAAVLGEGPLRRGSLLGLAALARSPEEERKFRAAAYLYDPEHDARVLAAARDSIVTTAPGASQALAELAAALRLIRQGKGREAKALLDRPLVREQAGGLEKIITLEGLLALSESRDLSDEQLSKLLQAELAIDRSLGAGGSDLTSSSPSLQLASWSGAVKSHGLAPLPSLALDSLTEFDPRECLYRDGRWVRP